jgi:pilus assembly protein FimV
MRGDSLECRQLLSGIGHVAEAAEVAVAPIASSSDSASSDSVELSSAQAGDGATAVSSDSVNATDAKLVAQAASAPEGEAAATNVEPTATSTAAAMAVGAATSGEGTESGSGVASIQQAVAAISGGPAARQPSTSDPTPWDEGSTGAVAEAPALEQSGGGGTLIVAAAAAAGANVSAAVAVAPSANQASGSTAAASAASSVAWLGGTADAALVGEISTDRSLVANVDSTTLAVLMTVGRFAAPRAIANPSDPLASTVDGDGGTPGAPAEPLPVDEPLAPPRSADVLTEFLPFGRASLEEAINRFLAPFEGLESELVHWQSPAGLVSAAAVVATAALAWEGVRRRARAVSARREECEERDEDFARFPGYPTAWSLED